MLTTLILLPILGALLLTTMQENTAADLSRIKPTALVTTLVTWFLSVIMWAQFDSSFGGYQFVSELTQPGFLSVRFGVDGLSVYFVILTTFTLPFCILASWENIAHSTKWFMVSFLVFESFTILVFSVLDLVAFYVAFEAVLIRLFLIVGIWGASAARVRASFLLFLYTLFGSVFMLLSFVSLYYITGTTDIEALTAVDLSFDTQKILWLGIFLSFAIKTPLVPFHIWLSRAHVEAPAAGSMVVVGLVLKLASYRILRVLIPILPEATAEFAPLAMAMGAISIVYASLSCLRQTDFKCLIAMSSVAHMGVVILGLFSNTVQGIEGAILLSLAHGFVSPAMFFLVGSVMYDRFHSRVIKYYRGLTTLMPMFSPMFFIFTVANMGTPTTANWVGEFMSLAGSFQLNPFITVVGATSIILSACYSIFLYNRISFRSYSPYLSWTTDLTRREFMILLTMLIPTILFGLYPNLFLNDLHYTVSTLLYCNV
uniref:NADH-ubiquinone oxidoreductase chain 4 n=1 Tax=Sterigmatomyces sp. TaxID=1972484 RepID=A0A7G7XQB9_9BASI|nr:NADH dehydrogenase subunit 4 [Sterigmatomyces sp.]